jgi:glycosyltransferase involved in cell wall biosynthesis
VISKEQVWVLIPAFNEANNIDQVLTELIQYGFAGYIVVDDGSTDSTPEKAAKQGAVVLRHPINQGVGAALRTGLSFANSKGINWILQIDGDGQHSVGSISEMLTHGSADLIIGTRDWNNYKFGATRKSAQFFLLFTLYLNGIRGVNDPTSGFRLFGKKAIDFYSEAMPPNFIGDTVEALILGAKTGLKIESQVVQMSTRQSGESSHTGMKIVRAFLVAILYSISYTTKKGKPC